MFKFGHLRLVLFHSLTFLSLGISQIIVESPTSFNISTSYYELEISKYTGMIESLKLKNSTSELVSDIPNYSLFFPEYIYENDGGYSNLFYIPPWHSDGVEIQILENSEDLGVITVNWITGQINSSWDFIFQSDIPTFRASITRIVAQSGVYSNAQHCIMYTPDMDMSSLINYEGNILVTMGSYEGDYDVEEYHRDVGDASAFTTTHSLWTAFDYGTPKYLPTFIWRKTDEDITAAIITTWTSPNQRATISYHGGGSSREHPGYAEGQWNWFGKSDSESLYLKAGTTYSMELIYYQNYGHIDTLIDYMSQMITPEAYINREIEDYRMASWGGRSSLHERYFWRYPQASSNEITSQRLFRHNAFGIPRSQNGMRDNHLLSFTVNTTLGGDEIDLAPNYGINPLFDSRGTEETDSSWIGSMSWNVNGIETLINFETLMDSPGINIFGNVDVSPAMVGDIGDISLNFSPSNRAKYEYSSLDSPIRFRSDDSIFDSISITIDKLNGIDTVLEGTKGLKMLLDKNNSEWHNSNKSYRYSMELSPRMVINDNRLESNRYKSFFVKPEMAGSISEIYVEPSADYYCTHVQSFRGNTQFDFWVQKPIEEIFIYSGETLPNYIFDSARVHRYTIESTEQDHVYRINCRLERGFYSLNIDSGRTENRGVSMSAPFPNPITSRIIAFNLISIETQEGDFYLYDIQGRMVEHQEIYLNGRGFQEVSIFIKSLSFPAGIYFAKLNFQQDSEVFKITHLK